MEQTDSANNDKDADAPEEKSGKTEEAQSAAPVSSDESGETGSEQKKPSEEQAPRPKRDFKQVEIADIPKGGALEVTVDHSIEKAMKILKRKLIKEGLFKELKLRRYYEKPSDRKKRKLKESLKKLRKEESRMKRNTLM